MFAIFRWEGNLSLPKATPTDGKDVNKTVQQWRKFRQTQMVTGPVSAALTAAIGTMGVAAGPMPTGSSSSSSTNTIYSPKSAIVQSVFPRLKGQGPSKGKRKSEPNTKHKK